MAKRILETAKKNHSNHKSPDKKSPNQLRAILETIEQQASQLHDKNDTPRQAK